MIDVKDYFRSEFEWPQELEIKPILTFPRLDFTTLHWHCFANISNSESPSQLCKANSAMGALIEGLTFLRSSISERLMTRTPNNHDLQEFLSNYLQVAATDFFRSKLEATTTGKHIVMTSLSRKSKHDDSHSEMWTWSIELPYRSESRWTCQVTENIDGTSVAAPGIDAIHSLSMAVVMMSHRLINWLDADFKFVDNQMRVMNIQDIPLTTDSKQRYLARINPPGS